ncbi:5'-methylthioadenosine/S-adenosylhomocysteine nucleosidase family protein [Herbidospora mongoliensis]|uniref:5'-methylthioadenosine/S-adenosylhomocysteine nucleosidase family protein n=1 Tax=Herbidospora mongoliensis TaxID=688067 RepID=UPI000830838E|nr:hypothetical protein [Herbidospora mongoliensis]
MTGISFSDARRAARAIRNSEHAASVRATIRPPGQFAGVRDRGPMPIILYAAARDGRLVWRGPDEFALLEPPVGTRPEAGSRGGPTRWLDRRWGGVVAFGPPALLLLVAVAFVPLVLAAPGWFVLPTILCLVALLYVTVMMATMMVRLIYQLIRPMVERGRDHRTVSDELVGEQWSIAICHLEDARRGEAFVDEINRWLGHRLPKGSDPDATLVCRLTGVTTSAMREIFTTKARHSLLGVDGTGLVFPLTPPPARNERNRDNGVTFLLLWFAAKAVILLAIAIAVASAERDVCGDSCAGRPAEFGQAVWWVIYRAVFTEPPGLSPATVPGWTFGFLISLLSIASVAVVAAATRLYIKARRRARDEFDRRITDLTATTTVLLLVATQVEQEQVTLAAREATGQAPEILFLDHHVAFDLGVAGGARILLGRCAAGAAAAGGSALTTRSLIDQLKPDYLILTGICFGLRREQQRIGDILISEQLRLLDPKKIVDVGGVSVEIQRGARPEPSVTLLNRTYAMSGGPKTHYGILLTSNVLVDSEIERARLIAENPDALGGEMEGGGFYAAAALTGSHWIVIKSICDWGAKKTKKDQPLAARNAADYVIGMIAMGGLGKAPPSGRREPSRA